MPEDLHQVRHDPEFIGRLPVITSVPQPRPEALIRILTEPKNALVRQYSGCSSSTASSSSSRRRARGDRRPGDPARHRCPRPARDHGEVLLSVMYDLPSRKDVARCCHHARDRDGQGAADLVPREAPKRERREKSA
jgi:ATP-dependent Clp protease ATP-binding subunit ClpX